MAKNAKIKECAAGFTSVSLWFYGGGVGFRGSILKSLILSVDCDDI